VFKNTKIYTGSPFHKGYVRSFANKQRVPLTTILKISLQQYKLLATHYFQQQTTHCNPQQLSKKCKTHYTNSLQNTKPYVICNHKNDNIKIINNRTNLTVLLLNRLQNWIKNEVEDLALDQNHSYANWHSKEGSKINLFEFFLEENQLSKVLKIRAHFSNDTFHSQNPSTEMFPRFRSDPSTKNTKNSSTFCSQTFRSHLQICPHNGFRSLSRS